jgi:ankyrin repeat protein
MFPNPHDALPLPPRPNLEHYKKRAKDLLRASHSPDPTALRTWAAIWIDSLVRLSDLTITPALPVRIGRWTDQLEDFVRQKLSQTPTLAAAQFVLARAHGFESWPKLAEHIAATTRANSPINHFEHAVDAIIAGDTATLEKLLRQHPALIRAHSTRRHQATLLHYISANGIEGYRQKTPQNIVQIAELLLHAGAAVNAVADVYGGSTTITLVATSLHPERAGVQPALLQLLLDHGATIDPPNSAPGSTVNSCLANGRIRAAEFLATHGSPLDLEGAAGLGRLDVVKTFFDDSGAPPSNATITETKKERAFLWSCEYGRNNVVDFLLQRGVDIQTQVNTGQTALHWAVIGGHEDTITLLISRGAHLGAKNTYGATPLDQALWSAAHGDPTIDYAHIADVLKHHAAKSKS